MNDVQAPALEVAVCEEVRMCRIGAFICRLAALEAPLPPEEPLPPLIPAEDADPENRVLGYLAGRRQASPLEIRLTLGLSRSMAYRTLQRLSLAGSIVSRGRTKALVYRAVSAAADPAAMGHHERASIHGSDLLSTFDN